MRTRSDSAALPLDRTMRPEYFSAALREMSTEPDVAW